MIISDPINGQYVSAYAVGLMGMDISDSTMFYETLNKLASRDTNVFQVSDIEELIERFNKIANSLYSISKTVNLDVAVSSGYSNGQKLRFTFDKPVAADDSELYIEATYRRGSDGGRSLQDITYHGLSQGQTAITSEFSEGFNIHFVFADIKYDNSIPMSDANLAKLELWIENGSGNWYKESEFSSEASSMITEEKNSLLIMLVLDCTTSLGSNDFLKMQQAAKNFVTTLVNGN